jgi:hypothetical protein
MPRKDPQGLVPDRAGTALIILDLISDFTFEDGDEVARAGPQQRVLVHGERRLCPRPRARDPARLHLGAHAARHPLALEHFTRVLGADIRASRAVRVRP